MGATNVTFANFVTTPTRPASALGYNRRNGFPISQLNFGTALRLVNANGAYLEPAQADKDGDKSALFRDIDGGLTGTPGMTVIADVPLLVSSGCVKRVEWNAWQCANRFLGLNIDSEGNEPVAPMSLRRDDAATVSLVGVPGNLKTVRMSVPMGRRFELAWVTAIPRRLKLTLQRGDVGDWIQVAIPYQAGIPFSVVRDFGTSTPLPAAASLAEVVNGTGDRYYWDAATSILHAKLFIRSGRTSTTLQVIG